MTRSLLLVLLLAAGRLAAQTTVAPAQLVDAEVRVRAPRFAPLEIRGRVVGVDSTGLAVLPLGGTLLAHVPLDAVQKLWVLDRAGASLRGGLLGFGFGSVAAVVACQYGLSRRGSAYSSDHEYDIVTSIGLCLPPGALLGAITGARLASPRWKPVVVRR